MEKNGFKPVLESIPNKCTYAPSALFGKSIRMSFGTSGEAEIQFLEPDTGGLVNIAISYDGVTQQRGAVCCIKEDFLGIQMMAESKPDITHLKPQDFL